MLYILTPIFCVALLCGTVFSFLKTDNKVSAEAASASDIKILTNSIESHYHQIPGAAFKAKVADMTTPIADMLGDWSEITNSDSKVGAEQATASKPAQGVYIDFKVGVKVPAWEEWTISFELKYECAFTCGTKYNLAAAFYHFLPDTTTDDPNDTLADSSVLSFDIMNMPQSPDPNMILCEGYHVVSNSGSYNYTYKSGSLTFTNESDNEQDYTLSFGIFASANFGTSTSSRVKNAYATLQNTSVESVRKLSIPKPTGLSYDYDGTDKSSTADSDIAASDWYTHNGDSWYVPGAW
ncbi:MAG: hypothetical protein K2H78_01855, partial [Clostridia bacterium]|nr:hypothetical protein [Clostridia bacterium]